MEALHIQNLEKAGALVDEEEKEKSGEQEEGGMEAPSPVTSTDEETDGDSEPERLRVVRRKVSFADAFGLNLVSVKEFDYADVTESGVSKPPEEVTLPVEDFCMSSLFTVPSSAEELDQRLQVQMVELESIELLPGTTTLRGTIRVVNLCYSKCVYVRISLDRWDSYFDLMAEYVPGSSDRKTDRFTFTYALLPPFEREGARVEFCLRYETSVGTFWANNKDMNYVLFCHQKGHAKEQGPQVHVESGSHRSKRSCLKAIRRRSAIVKARETINTATVAAGAEEAEKQTAGNAEIQTSLFSEERKPLVECVKRRHRAANLPHVEDYIFHRRRHAQKALSPDSKSGLAHTQRATINHHRSQSVPTSLINSACLFHNRRKEQSSQSPQVLTYHQIPLLTLDWNDDKSQQWRTADMDDIWTEGTQTTLSKASEENTDNTPSVSDIWEAFLHGTDDNIDEQTSVCDIWQAFLNGPDCKDHSGVPESEWLQTAASVLPANDKKPQTQNTARNQEHTFHVGSDTTAHLHVHTSDLWQPLSPTRAALLANVALNTEENQPAETCVSTPRDDNKATLDTSQKSQTNSVTDTLQEFGRTGAAPVSKGSFDSLIQWHKHVIWEGEREGKIVRAGGNGGGKPFTPPIADLVTSSGETETTDMTAMPEFQNANAVDRISQGARRDEGLFSSKEREATGTAHNVMDDTLAFRETIAQGTKDGERFVFTSTQGEEERFSPNCTEKKVNTAEEVWRPHAREDSQGFADEQHQSRENPLTQRDEDEIRAVQSHADEFRLNRTCEGKFRQSQMISGELKLDESEHDTASKSKDADVFRKAKAGVELSYCTTREKTKGLMGTEVEINQRLEEEARQHNEKALQVKSSIWQEADTLIFSKVHKQSGPNPAAKELCAQTEKENLTPTQTDVNVTLKCSEKAQSEDDTRQSHGGIIQEQKPCVDINISGRISVEVFGEKYTMEPVQTRNIFKSEQGHDERMPSPTDETKLDGVEVIEQQWCQIRDGIMSQKQDVGREITPEEVLLNENLTKEDTSAVLQWQPEALKGKGGDRSRRYRDERVSIEKLKIEAMEEMMGNVESPRGESENAAAKLKEQEFSAEPDSSPHVECKKLSEGTKDPITAENALPLELIEPGLEGMFTEIPEQDLAGRISKEGKGEISKKDTNDEGMGGNLADIPGFIHDCQLTKDMEKDFGCDVETQRSQSLPATKYTRSEFHIDSNSIVHLNQDRSLASACDIQCRQSLTAQTLSSPNDEENFTQIKERSASHEEMHSKESFLQSAQSPQQHPSSSSESSFYNWWKALWFLNHMIRALVCSLLVAGFFVVTLFYDIPACFALYILSLCWWFYKWKRHRVVEDKGKVR